MFADLELEALGQDDLGLLNAESDRDGLCFRSQEEVKELVKKNCSSMNIGIRLPTSID